MSELNEPLGADVPQGLIRLRGRISYDGTDFSGWGMQPDRRTVQGDLESAFASILRTPRLVIQCAGRTDAGVHAIGQVFHIDVPIDKYIGHERMTYRLNSLLDEDVVVQSLENAPAGFDARFSALSRTYEYLINDGQRQPLMRRFVLLHGYPIDLEHAKASSQQLLGLHDFSAFCKPKPYGTTIRELQVFDWARREDGLIAIKVKADAFCYSMVRGLVGAVLDVAADKKPASWLTEYLEGGKRETGVFVAPACGLTFISVEYPPDNELESRMAITKRTRSNDGSTGFSSEDSLGDSSADSLDGTADGSY